jgi:putative multiple sugar transport system substrate-binding protein
MNRRMNPWLGFWLLLAVLVMLPLLLTMRPSIPAGIYYEGPPSPSSPPRDEPPGTVGIVLPTKDEPRWLQDETRFRAAFKAAGYADSEVQILFSQGDSAKEKANVEALISQGIKVLVICPQDGTAAAAAADMARAVGVKVISYDRLIRDTAVDYYVTFDAVEVGRAQGQYLVDQARGKGNPLYLYAGSAADNNAYLFFQGAWKVLQPKIADGTFEIKNSSEAVVLQGKATLERAEMAKVIGQVTTEWKPDVAKNLAESNLMKIQAADKEGAAFILAPADFIARAIADAFAADPDVTRYVITGQGAEKASVQSIFDGKQSMTVLKDERTLVKDAVAAAVAFLKGEMPGKTTAYNNGQIDVPAKPSAIVTVTKDNVKAALIDSGYYRAEDFTGLP